jgi:hypothetical protein
METVQVTVDVPKETQELVQAIVEVVKAAKLALADGFQPGQDLPVIAVAAFQNLLAGVQGIAQLPEEAKADPGKLAVVLALGLDQLF